MALSNDSVAKNNGSKILFSTFKVADRLYGIDVTRVQEVTKAMPCTRVPLAPKHMRGLINLRGQIATAIELNALFEIKAEPRASDNMNVFCEIRGALVALIVDEIGDVIEVETASFEETPETIPRKVRHLMSGVYKIPGDLLSILDIDKLEIALSGISTKALIEESR